ncbi:unnamed protein product [Owenia fusiformis]|uniref:Multiple inositol polyphosphate phosphatase 1 n=1 Tax=Owenia fusiformis TaxID=6347 RepID=A0A8J1U2I7_OWEFU|nr:unnamed protein product [Owenia fusiformis]
MEQIYAASTILSCLVFILQTLYTTISSNNSDQKCHYHGNESAYRLYSTRTVYGVIHNESADLKDDPPQGCVAQGVYMVSRHGTRFPVIEEIKRMQALLPKIEQDILPHLKKGRLCSEEIQALEQWHLLYQSHVDMNMNLADVGIQEMYGLGNRMQQMFPELLDVKNHNRLVFKHTGKPRVHQSTAVFIQGLSNVAESSPVDEVTESFNMEDLSKNKRLLESIEVCKRNKISFKTREEEPIRRFDAGYQMLDLIASVEARLGLPHDTVTNTDIDVLYDICRYDYAIYRVSPWCAIFSKENLRLLEYRQDLKYHWRYGFADPVNYESSCVLVSDLLQYFKNHKLHAHEAGPHAY